MILVMYSLLFLVSTSVLRNRLVPSSGVVYGICVLDTISGKSTSSFDLKILMSFLNKDMRKISMLEMVALTSCGNDM